MRLLVSIDEHYISDGTHVYSTEGTTPYKFFWSEYLNVFEQVLVLARIRQDRSYKGHKEAIANGPKVHFFALPDFKGPYQYLSVKRKVVAAIREAIPKADAYLLRGPGIIGGFVAAELERQGKIYAAQVIGDPWNVFGAGRVGGFLRPVYRRLFTRELKRICKKAVGVSYVTRSTLQQCYPASPGAFVSSWSDVQIGSGLASEQDLEARLRRYADIGRRTARVGFIGSMEQPYKGADVLVRAVAECRSKGFDVVAELAGGGRLRPEYEMQAKALGLNGHVRFLGRVGAGKPVFDFLNSVDLFVMPSLTEGLPRAMIEAMARGCPSIGTTVGGIPELLQPGELVPPADPAALANKIMEKISRPEDLAEMARRNHGVAKGYMPEHAHANRFAFLHALRNRAYLRKSFTSAQLQKRLALVVSVPWMTLIFRGQVAELQQAGFRVTVICGPGPETADMEAEGAEVKTVSIEREIAIFKDLRALWRLWRIFRGIRPDIVNVGSPKGGLLGGLAARLAGVPHRIYTLHGLRLETAKGWKRGLLILMERVACRNVQYVRCVSPSLQQQAIMLRLARPEQTYVVAAGSANGVDLEHFKRTPLRMAEAQQLRQKLAIPASSLVIGFVGRFTRDKGIPELYAAFRRLRNSFPDFRLLLVGDFEDGDPVPRAVRDAIISEQDIVVTGMVPDTAPYYALMDVLVLPTYREGLGTVSIEAQAAGVPVVTTRVTGAVDSIVDGITGLLVPPADEQALAGALRKLLAHAESRRRMGQAGAAWVEDRFRQEVVWRALIDDYTRICGEPRMREKARGAYR